MSEKLGCWAAIDIETTGIDPNSDQVIDVGVLQFEGTKLIKKYQSLVAYEGHLSQFIQKLTGITAKMLRSAPTWNVVESEISEFDGLTLLAHNSDFEKSFLSNTFDDVEFVDSIPFLALVHPGRSQMNLESYIIDFGIAEKEIHRGYEDSVDLIKVILASSYLRFIDQKYSQLYNQTLMFRRRYDLGNYWYFKFWDLEKDELNEIAKQLEFDIEKHAQIFIDNHYQVHEDEKNYSPSSLNFSKENIEQILRDEEGLSQIFEGYKYRESQETLALKVGQSFKNSIHAVIQAPTGTGKTVGYLVPSALYALNEGKQVLVATGTKALQEQAMFKDVPILKRLLGGTDLRVSRLIGSANHYCELLFRKGEGELDLFENNDFDKTFSELYFELLFYQNSNKEYITRLDTPYVLRKKFETFEKMDTEIAVDFRSCSGSRCPYKHGCSYINDLRKAKDAHIIIGNHALMFSWPKGFPRPQHVIVDEAHRVESDATQAFTVSLSAKDLRSYIKALNNMQGPGALFYLLALEDEHDKEVIDIIKQQVQQTAQILSEHILPLEEKAEIYFKQRPRYTSEFWNELPMINPASANTALAKGIIGHIESLKFVIEGLVKLLIPFDGRWDISNLEDDHAISAYTKYQTFFQHTMDLYDVLCHCLEDKQEYANSMKFHEQFGFALESAIIDIGKKVHDNLLVSSESVVFTSATISNETGDMAKQGSEWPLGYLYLKPERRYKGGFFLPGVYDYKNNAKVYLCDDTPSFYEPDFVPKVIEGIIPLVKDIGGRSLFLFSSRKRFEIAREVLLDKLGKDIPLFIQGMGHQVVEEYKKSGQGILLGMEMFGEGIDIPGDALKFVFIDKIPDIRQDFIIQKRRDFFEKQFHNEFQDYFLANRARGLSQKLGRLLRTDKDRGGAIVVDARLKRWKGKTFDQFARLLKPYQIQRTNLNDATDDLKEFLSSF